MVSTPNRPDGPPPPMMARPALVARAVGIGVGTVSGLGLLAVTLIFLFVGVMFGEGSSRIVPALPFLALALLPLASVALFLVAGEPLKGVRDVRRSELPGHAVMAVLFLIQPVVDLLRVGEADGEPRPERALEGETAQFAWLPVLAAALALCHLVVALELWRLPRMPTEG